MEMRERREENISSLHNSKKSMDVFILEDWNMEDRNSLISGIFSLKLQ